MSSELYNTQCHDIVVLHNNNVKHILSKCADRFLLLDGVLCTEFWLCCGGHSNNAYPSGLLWFFHQGGQLLLPWGYICLLAGIAIGVRVYKTQVHVCIINRDRTLSYWCLLAVYSPLLQADTDPAAKSKQSHHPDIWPCTQSSRLHRAGRLALHWH